MQIDSAPFDDLPPSNCLCKPWIVELVPRSAFAKSGRTRALSGHSRKILLTIPPMTLSSEEIERYARQIVLHGLGGPGQNKLKAARALVISAGGLGSPALRYLAGAGVGTLEDV